MKVWTLAVISAVAGLPCPAVHATCLSYGAEARLHGVLSRHTFPGPPNYDSIANGDRAETYYFITPRTRACVNPGRDEAEPAVAQTGKLQLIFTAQSQSIFKQLSPLLNKHVVCTGTPMHSISGHHHSTILLWNARCDKAPGES